MNNASTFILNFDPLTIYYKNDTLASAGVSPFIVNHVKKLS
jgi:hypothetical protein